MSVSTIGAVTAGTSAGTLITCTTANSKGTYAELSASTAITAAGFATHCAFSLGADHLVDIATGAAGAEVVLLADLYYTDMNTASFACAANHPLAIASGTRVAARTAATSNGATMRVLLQLWEIGTVNLWGCTAIDTYGATAADSGGIQVDPGGVGNTKGAYSQITGSTSAASEQIGIAIGSQANTARSAGGYLVDLATGAAAAETVVIADTPAAATAGNFPLAPAFLPLMPLVIANATRIAARAQSTVTDATDRLLDVLVYAARGADAIGGSSGGGLKLVGPGGLAG